MRLSFIVIISIFIFGNNPDEEQPSDNQKVVYHNSFESSADTINWHGYATVKFSNDHYDNSGKQSVYVSGIDIGPHFKYELSPFENDGYFLIQAYAKCLHQSGVIVFSIENDTSSTEIWIRNSSWHFYQSQDTLFCPANKRLSIELFSGGITKGEMLVDDLKVIRVK